MALDFVQVRWQQIRLAESSQLIENENIALKKELAALKEKPDPSVPVVVVTEAPRGADGKVIRQICSIMKNDLMRTQSDIVKLKLSYAQEVAGLAAQRNQMSKAFQKYVTLYDIKQAEFEAMEYSRDQLQERLDETKDELEMSKNGQAQDIARLKLKYKNARTDLSDSQAEVASLKEKVKAMDEKYKELSAVKAESDAHYNVLNQEYLGMQALIDKLRLDSEVALVAAENSKLFMQEEYEKIVGELGYENEYLRKTCAEQEEQIARLTNTLIGNKSHFARYVEVKSENLTLQSKLSAVQKESSRRFGNLDQGSLMGASSLKPSDPGGLPAHQKRKKGALANAGAAVIASVGGGGGGGGGGNSGGGTQAWGAAARQPSPRGDASLLAPPADIGLPSHVAPKRPLHSNRDPGASFLSSGVQLMFSGGPTPGDAKASPQSSPRTDAARGMSKAESSSSIISQPNVLPPPVAVPKPARNNRLYSPRVETVLEPRQGSQGAQGSGRPGRRQGSAESEPVSASDAAPVIAPVPITSSQGLRGRALTDSRGSPQSSPRSAGLSALGKAGSSSSMAMDPDPLPLPTAATIPAPSAPKAGSSGFFAALPSAPVKDHGAAYISSASSASTKTSAPSETKSPVKKSLRLDPTAAGSLGAQAPVPKIELSFGDVGRSRGGSQDKQIVI